MDQIVLVEDTSASRGKSCTQRGTAARRVDVVNQYTLFTRIVLLFKIMLGFPSVLIQLTESRTS